MSTQDQTALLQGTLDLLILRTLALGSHHGQGIARVISQRSGDTLLVDHGSLYPPSSDSRSVAGSEGPGEPPTTTAARGSTRSPPSGANSSSAKRAAGTGSSNRSPA